MEVHELELLKQKLHKDFNLNLQPYKDNFLMRRLEVQMRAANAETCAEYIRALKRPDVYQGLLYALAINVSEFFRDSEVFEALQYIIADLSIEKVKKGRNFIRVWSAGCASGEEPYTMALLFHLLLGEDLSGFNVPIVATDIDGRALEKAKEGIYDAQRVKNLEPTLLRAYFTKHGDKYQLREGIRKMVRFSYHNLFSPAPLGGFDIILCRNVMIYFGKKEQDMLINRFYEALNPKGFLVFGMTETMPPTAASKFATFDARNRIYRKI